MWSVFAVAASAELAARLPPPHGPVSVCHRALLLESKGGGKDLPKTREASWADRGTDRNRRASIHRSHLSLIPLKKLFPGRNDILVYRHPMPEQENILSHAHRHPGQDPHWKIPVAEWPAVLHRIDQGEPLRKIAGDYSVSHEAVQRVIGIVLKQGTGG